ncbi:MAG: GNAT family N-acetyltransferase [Opitutaceae bacterium]|nr:GNAT family N-acetyltransferase [Opitutaceae bacterium]MBP9912120.1 GNAT family N-acetyltransferase [Opitutaceae bacterium]
MAHSLRPVGDADTLWLWSLKRTTMKTYVEQTWGKWDDDVQAERFRKNFKPDDVQIIIIDGHDAGLLHVERGDIEIFLVNIQISPEFQNRGLGTEVMRALLAEARTCQLPLRLQVLKVNPARNLYERIGFTVAGETDTHYQMRWSP